MIITKDLELGMTVVKLLKDTRKVLTIDEISNETSGSKTFLEQICRKVRMGGLIKSLRGPGGGYMVTQKGKTATAYDVLKCLGKKVTSDGASYESSAKLEVAILKAFTSTVI